MEYGKNEGGLLPVMISEISQGEEGEGLFAELDSIIASKSTKPSVAG